MRFLAWLEDKIDTGYDMMEYEAAQRLIDFQRKGEHFLGLAHRTVSASGPSVALAIPDGGPNRSTERIIDRETPYLMCVFPYCEHLNDQRISVY